MRNNQLPEGFIPWHGGDNPVPGKFVRVKLQGGYITPDGRKDRANTVEWRHILNSGNVIGYKVVEDTPEPALFSTKFRVGMTYKTRNGEVEYKLAAIIPEAKRPLVFLDVDSKSATMRYADGRMSDTKNYFSDWDVVLARRTVYVNIMEHGAAVWQGSKATAEACVVKDRTYLAVAVPVEVEE